MDEDEKVEETDCDVGNGIMCWHDDSDKRTSCECSGGGS